MFQYDQYPSDFLIQWAFDTVSPEFACETVEVVSTNNNTRHTVKAHTYRGLAVHLPVGTRRNKIFHVTHVESGLSVLRAEGKKNALICAWIIGNLYDCTMNGDDLVKAMTADDSMFETLRLLPTIMRPSPLVQALDKAGVLPPLPENGIIHTSNKGFYYLYGPNGADACLSVSKKMVGNVFAHAVLCCDNPPLFHYQKDAIKAVETIIRNARIKDNAISFEITPELRNAIGDESEPRPFSEYVRPSRVTFDSAVNGNGLYRGNFKGQVVHVDTLGKFIFLGDIGYKGPVSPLSDKADLECVFDVPATQESWPVSFDFSDVILESGQRIARPVFDLSRRLFPNARLFLADSGVHCLLRDADGTILGALAFSYS